MRATTVPGGSLAAGMVMGVILASVSLALGPMAVASFLLLVAGLEKIQRPAPTALALARAGIRVPDLAVRALGGLEYMVAIAALDAGVVGGTAVALLFGGFATFTARQVLQARATGVAADCGCFGNDSAPVGWTHVVVNLAIAGAGIATAVVDADGWRESGFWAGTPVMLLAAVTGVGVYALLTDLPRVQALRRPSRTSGA